MKSDFSFSTPLFSRSPRQDKIIKKLNQLLGPGPASFFEDACRLMALEPNLPSTTHLVSHLLREIDGSLIDVLNPFTDNASQFRVERKDQVQQQEILSVLHEFGITKDTPLAQALINSIEKEETQRQKILSILNEFDIAQDNPLSKTWLNSVGSDNNNGLHKWAHRNNLDKPRSVDEEFLKFYLEMEDVIYSVLNLLETKYLVIYKQLDDLRKKENPSKKDISTFKRSIPNNFAVYSYFFKDLNNPNWLRPLFDNGFFSSPSAPIENKEEQTISYPQWPQSMYLVSMAPIEPDFVSGIILKIDTDNQVILTDLLDAIYRFPYQIAAKHAEQICKWNIKFSYLIGKKIGKLVSYLAKGGEINAAILLTKAFLRLKLVGNKNVNNISDEYLPGQLVPNFGISKWEYCEFLKNNFHDLYLADPEKATLIVINTLDEAITFSATDINKFQDLSEFWRPAIEDHPQNHGNEDPRYELVTAIRNSAEYWIRQEPDNLKKILNELDKKEGVIFKRVSLYLIKLFGDANLSLVEKKIIDKELFDRLPTYHEYVNLVKGNFSKIAYSKQQTFLKWIKVGPKVNSDEEFPDTYKAWWQLRWLTILKGQLDVEWEKFRQTLLKTLPEPEHPDFLSWFGELQSGPTSPVSDKDFRNMSIENTITFLNNWKMPEDFTMDSYEGISRALKTAISEEPKLFSEKARKFIGCDPTYIHGFFTGLQEALKAERYFDWIPIIELMKWVMGQNKEIQGRVSGESWDRDPDWGWTRTEIARLLQVGFDAKKNPIPFKACENIWQILLPLTNDPNPTIAEDTNDSMGPAMMSLNTTRGTAFHSLISYALWKKRNLLQETKVEEKEINFSVYMPEVLDVLENHLNPLHDPSPTIRAVYGWRFPNLAYLDHAWAIEKKGQIFPKSIKERQFWNASWSSYIGFNGANKNMLTDLYTEYMHSVSSIKNSRLKIEMGINPNDHLVEHLILFYAWGEIDLNSDIITTFWNNAPIELRGHAIRFIGTAKKGAPPETIARLRLLWERRFEVIRNVDDRSQYIDELKTFGWIFVSTAFSDKWVISNLEEVLSFCSEVDNHHGVVERLANISDNYLSQSIVLIGKMIEGDKNGWGVSLWSTNIRKILSKALESTNSVAKNKAEILINKLTAHGHFDFKDLIHS
jgi:hypothetical protein